MNQTPRRLDMPSMPYVPHPGSVLAWKRVCYQYGFESNFRLGDSRLCFVSCYYSRISMPVFNFTSIPHAVARFTLHNDPHPSLHIDQTPSSPEALLPFPGILNPISHVPGPALHAIAQSLEGVSDRFARATRHARDGLPDASARGADDAAGRLGDSGDSIAQGGGDEADRVAAVGVV